VSFAVGSLVRARGREWVVLPESSDELLQVRPLGGTEDEVTGLYLPLEGDDVKPAHFDLPDPERVGDQRACRLLRDAVRLGSRAGAGPFRSFARIAVEPRPYQLVPLLMALRLDPVRLLIADDVGVGKSIEAGLIARELLDRGEVARLAVLCPPHLAEQWQVELREKFHIDAELVLPGTAGRLERACRIGQSLFEVYPQVVVSLDFIKSDRRRDEFVRTAPELIVVDEAHTCAFGYEGRGSGHQRHQLVRQLAADPARHLVLVTATPHSGKEEAFRSLLSLLHLDFADLPETLTGPEQAPLRRRLAAHFVQRRRADIERFMQTETPFPKREEAEASYRLTPEYRRLFDRVLRYARETVADPAGGRHRQRVRWWSALALLRALASSPTAAAATLRSRAPSADTESPEEADELGRRAVLDLAPEESAEGADVCPGGDAGDDTDEGGPNRRRLLEMAREADALAGGKDAKLQKAAELVEGLLRDGYRPILFCRFIATAEYVARELGKRLPKDVTVAAVTGVLPPADREARVLELGEAPKRVLVCTDCLSEGINLQEHFDAVLHYDLAWSPTRHEQREGRVDRYGQARPTIRVLTYYGLDTQIDGIVLDVLIRKHKAIRSSLGIWVPVPVDTNAVVEAIFEGVLLREKGGAGELVLPGLDEYLRPRKEELYTQWESAADREKRSRTMFAQESIKVDDVARELTEARAAIGSADDVAAFTREALGAYGAVFTEQQGILHADLREVPRALRDMLGGRHRLAARFELPVGDGILYLSRTHPVVEALASHVMETALDSGANGVARRAGAIRTRAVTRRTTFLLLRLRYDVVTRQREVERSQLAEECRLLAFAGPPDAPEWLDDAAAEALLRAKPDANIYPEQAAGFVRAVVEVFDQLRPRLEEEAGRRARALLDAHRRVREAAELRGVSYRVEPQVPVDLLGVYVYLPVD
jgi:superfamily II DNA or RNA helicase